MIDWTVNVGNLLQIAVVVGGGMWVFQSLRADVRIVKTEIDNLTKRQDQLGEAFKQLGDILRQVAVQDQRIAQLDKVVDELRHGQGFVNPMRS
jgi:prefoldin subunit 5